MNHESHAVLCTSSLGRRDERNESQGGLTRGLTDPWLAFARPRLFKADSSAQTQSSRPTAHALPADGQLSPLTRTEKVSRETASCSCKRRRWRPHCQDGRGSSEEGHAQSFLASVAERL